MPTPSAAPVTIASEAPPTAVLTPRTTEIATPVPETEEMPPPITAAPTPAQILTLPSTVTSLSKSSVANTSLATNTTVALQTDESGTSARSEPGSALAPSDVPTWIWIAVGAGAGALVCVVGIVFLLVVVVKRKKKRRAARAGGKDESSRMVAISSSGNAPPATLASTNSKSSSMYCTLPQEQSQYSSVFDAQNAAVAVETPPALSPQIGQYKSTHLTHSGADGYNVGNIE